jgi:hypothetical protein
LEIIGNRIALFPPKTEPNPTELVAGLAERPQMQEPIKRELKRASEAMANRTLK